MGWVTAIPKPPQQPMAFTDHAIRFLWTTDEHTSTFSANTDVNVVGLRRAIARVNEWRPNAYISTGDNGLFHGEDTWRYLLETRHVLRPFKWAIGNHDEVEYEPDGSAGNPNTAQVEVQYDRAAPFYRTDTLVSGDGTFAARCLHLDCNFYADDPDGGGDSPDHEPADRIGVIEGSPPGGYRRMIPQSQLDWVASTLAADTDSDCVLVFVHYMNNTGGHIVDWSGLADALQADGRPTALFGGHLHVSPQNFGLTTSDEQRTYDFYQMCAGLDTGAWCEVTLSFADSDIVIDSMVVCNFTQPGELTIESPFVLAS